MNQKMQQGMIRTDLALEAREASGEISGVSMEQEELGGSKITRVEVLNEAGAGKIGKPIGKYITIENAALSSADALCDSALVEAIAREIRGFFALGEDENAMVAGLGNRNLTPDSLGPKVAERILVSRHILSTMPDLLDARVRSVSAICPGVMGETGIETGELVACAAKAVRPSCLIVVDSLAARSAARILGTVQISNAGVVPGSGVGNHRTALTRQSLGLPVVAIGVPMVVHALTIGKDTLERAFALMEEAIAADNSYKDFAGRHLEEAQLGRIMDRALEPLENGFVVTPVSIDEAVKNVADLVAEAINVALQPELSREEIAALV